MSSGIKRLHISPLYDSTLAVVLSGDFKDLASDISLHAVQTFPERNYGFVTLPLQAATRLQNKLNGCLIRGQKVRITEARLSAMAMRDKERMQNDPDRKPEKVGMDLQKDSVSRHVTKGLDKNVKGGAIAAARISPDRKVVRGWTDEERSSVKDSRKSSRHKEGEKRKMKKKKEQSITGQSECLFRTALPANKTDVEPEKHKKKKRRRDQADRETTVHEYENTTKHASFLKQKSIPAESNRAVSFVDGVGWVNEAGQVVEEDSRLKTMHASSKRPSPPRTTSEQDPSESRSDESVTPANPTKTGDSEKGEKDEARSSDLNSGIYPSEIDIPSDRSRSGSKSSSIGRQEEGNPAPVKDVQRPNLQPTKEIHPLEMLFKKPSLPTPKSAELPQGTLGVHREAQFKTPSKPRLELATSFSFFGNDNDEHDDDEGQRGANHAQRGLQEMTPASHYQDKDFGSSQNGELAILTNMPQTPFTQQDFNLRRQRSAAPTPDTAAIGKTFGDVLHHRRRGRTVSDARGSSPPQPLSQDIVSSSPCLPEIKGYPTPVESDPDVSFQLNGQDVEKEMGHTVSKPSNDTQADTSKILPSDNDVEPTPGMPLPTNEFEVDKQEESEFSKTFWENRGDYNREWKRQRREALKLEKAQKRKERRGEV